MLYLALDHGDKRTGLAVGDDVTQVVSPVDVIEAKSDAAWLEAVREAAKGYGVDALVLGLPTNMDGSEGPRAKRVRELAEQLQQRLDLPVHLHDERLSSYAADQQMARSGLTRGQKKQRRDALAAAAILRDFLSRPR